MYMYIYIYAHEYIRVDIDIMYNQLGTHTHTCIPVLIAFVPFFKVSEAPGFGRQAMVYMPSTPPQRTGFVGKNGKLTMKNDGLPSGKLAVCD